MFDLDRGPAPVSGLEVEAVPVAPDAEAFVARVESGDSPW